MSRLKSAEATARQIEPEGLSSQDLSAEVRLLQMLSQIAAAANLARTSGEALQLVVDLVCNHTGWAVGHAFLVEPGGELSSTGIWHLDDPVRHQPFRDLTNTVRFERGTLPGQVLEKGQAVWIEDIESDPEFVRKDEGAGLKAALAFPVLCGKAPKPGENEPQIAEIGPSSPSQTPRSAAAVLQTRLFRPSLGPILLT
jgi:hypothetical protein